MLYAYVMYVSNFHLDVTGDYEFDRNGEVVAARNTDGPNYDDGDDDDDIRSKGIKLQS